MTVLVIDGLGHGPLADIAARAGIEAMADLSPVAPAEDLRELHAALKGTVGAVAGIARFDVAQSTLSFSASRVARRGPPARVIGLRRSDGLTFSGQGLSDSGPSLSNLR